MVNDTFIRQLSSSIKSQRDSYELEVKAKLHEAELIKANSADKWGELKAWMREAVDKLNQCGADLDYSERVNDFRVGRTFRGRPSVIEVDFSQYGMGITVNGCRGGKRLQFIPVLRGAEIVYTDGYSESMNTLAVCTIELVGEKILRQV